MSRRRRERDGDDSYEREERFRRRFDDDEPRYGREALDDERRPDYGARGRTPGRQFPDDYRAGGSRQSGDYAPSRDYGDYEYGREDYDEPSYGREGRGRFSESERGRLFERGEEREERSGYSRRGRFDDAPYRFDPEELRRGGYRPERDDDDYPPERSRAMREYGRSDNQPSRRDEPDARRRSRPGDPYGDDYRRAEYGREDYGRQDYRREDYDREDYGRESAGNRRYAEQRRPARYDYDREDWDFRARSRTEPQREEGRGREYPAGARGRDRGWWERVSDEVASWFGDEEAERRRRGDIREHGRSELRETDEGAHRGRGPRNYRRSDERIREDVNDQLTDDFYLDASGIDVEVRDGEVILSGSVHSRRAKRLAEEIAEGVSGVTNVENRIRVRREPDELSETGERAGLSTSAVEEPTSTGEESTRTGSTLAGSQSAHAPRLLDTSAGWASTGDDETGATGSLAATSGTTGMSGAAATMGTSGAASSGDVLGLDDEHADASDDEHPDRR